MGTLNFSGLDEDNIVTFNSTGGGKAGLAKLVTERGQAAQSVRAQFQARRSIWLAKLSALFEVIEYRWLEDLVDSGQVEITHETTKLSEEYIGEYEAPEIMIRIANSIVRLEPRGTLIVGAAGRVDMTGPNGTLLLLLDSTTDDMSIPFEKRQFEWSIVSRVPQVVRSILDEDSFSDGLSSLI